MAIVDGFAALCEPAQRPGLRQHEPGRAWYAVNLLSLACTWLCFLLSRLRLLTPSRGVADFLMRLFRLAPAERLSIEQIRREKWFNGPMPEYARSQSFALAASHRVLLCCCRCLVHRPAQIAKVMEEKARKVWASQDKAQMVELLGAVRSRLIARERRRQQQGQQQSQGRQQGDEQDSRGRSDSSGAPLFRLRSLLCPRSHAAQLLRGGKWCDVCGGCAVCFAESRRSTRRQRSAVTRYCGDPVIVLLFGDSCFCFCWCSMAFDPDFSSDSEQEDEQPSEGRSRTGAGAGSLSTAAGGSTGSTTAAGSSASASGSSQTAGSSLQGAGSVSASGTPACMPSAGQSSSLPIAHSWCRFPGVRRPADARGRRCRRRDGRAAAGCAHLLHVAQPGHWPSGTSPPLLALLAGIGG